jgi:uncharacterized protein (TIGR02444 family)
VPGGGADAEAHWRFILAVYAAPGVAAACLSLQDRRGVDVCLLLHALWLGAACAYRLDEAGLARLRAAAGPWQAEIVVPLRAVRRRLKAGPPPAPDARTDAIRAKLQALEIEAERTELEVLLAALPVHPLPPGAESKRFEAAFANLETVCPPASPEDKEALDLLAGAGIAALVSSRPDVRPDSGNPI